MNTSMLQHAAAFALYHAGFIWRMSTRVARSGQLACLPEHRKRAAFFEER